jgi:hypothetical protein
MSHGGHVQSTSSFGGSHPINQASSILRNQDEGRVRELEEELLEVKSFYQQKIAVMERQQKLGIGAQ